MSIKATQPEDSEREAFEAWRRGETKMKNKDDAVARLGFGQDAVYENRHTKAMWYAWQKRAALATPSPQPAEAKTAAVDGMTDEEAQAIHSDLLVRSRLLRYAERLNDWTANELVKAIAAAIATQDGGHD